MTATPHAALPVPRRARRRARRRRRFHRPDRLDGFVADTYWPALHAQAAGTPLARPDVVVRPRPRRAWPRCWPSPTSTACRSCPGAAARARRAAALPVRGGHRDRPALRSTAVIEIDERSMTVTVQAGKNGRELEAELNARGLMLPHYPASVEWATVGGYVAARGSGVLSTRYGKIEDLVLSLRVATPAGGLVDTVARAAARGRAGADAAVRRLGGHARRDHAGHAAARPAAGRAPLRRRRLPVRERRHRGHPPRAAGRATGRRSCGSTTTRPRAWPSRRSWARTCSGVYCVLAFEGEAEAARWRSGARSRRRARRAPRCSTRRSASAGGTGATTSTTRRTGPSCPRSGARSTSSPPTPASRRSTRRCGRAVREPYARHRPRAADALLPLVPVGHDDLRPLRGPGRRPDALALHDRIWEDGMTAALDAGARHQRPPRGRDQARPVHAPPARRGARRAPRRSRRRWTPTTS